MVAGGVSFYHHSEANTSDAFWVALAEVASSISDLMDYELTGTVIAMTGSSAMPLTGLNYSIPGVAASVSLVGFNTAIEQ